ncbi:MAG: NGG1p interacting factor NIF3 [Verrucomicrobiota bacterium]|nr:NGG1p interacting factor NIF3 [Verrucomicrobiota bacterium]
MTYKFSFYVPETHLEVVKNALFDSGAGKIGNYDKCCWQTKGTGQFRSLKNSSPHIGSKNKLEVLEEYKVEMICDGIYIEDAEKALLDAHPYETPAYNISENYER